MKSLRSLLIIGYVAIFGLAAATVSASYVSYNVGGTIPIDGANSPFTVKMDGISYGTVWAASMVLTKKAGAASMPATIITDCVDFLGTANSGATYTFDQPATFSGQIGLDPTWGANATGLNAAAQKTLNEAAAIQAAAYIFYTYGLKDGYLNAPVTGPTAATGIEEQEALQLAIWDALYDTTAGQDPVFGTATDGARFAVTGGLTSPSGLVINSLMKTMLSSVPEPDNKNYTGYLLVPDPSKQHGYISQEFFYNVTPVPEPPTIIAGIAMLVPLGSTIIRRFRKSRST